MNNTYTYKESEFWIQQLRSYDGTFTYVNDIKGWLDSNYNWKHIRTLDELRLEMRKDRYFQPRHFRKIDAAITHLMDEGVKFEPK